MAKYRLGPVIVEAIQFTGYSVEGWEEVEKFVGGDAESRGGRMVIATLQGPMWADEGDWIIEGAKDEFYTCKPDIFEATYEPMEAQ